LDDVYIIGDVTSTKNMFGNYDISGNIMSCCGRTVSMPPSEMKGLSSHVLHCKNIFLRDMG